MISLLKVVFTVAVVYAVWFLFKYRSRIAAAHKAVMAEKVRARGAPTAAPASRTPVAQDLLPCPKCGAYIAQGTRCSCEKV